MVNRIMLNEDDTHFFFTRDSFENLSESDIRAFIRQYAGGGVGDMLLCCAGRLMGFPSQTRDSWLDKYAQTEENGRQVDYRAHPVVRCAHRLYVEQGLDFYAVCIDELRKIGIHPWLSIRMNDCHDNNLPASFLHPRAFHAHPELRRVTYRAPAGYYDNCLDYAQKEVRQMMLNCIEETALRYDAHGIELDWQREAFCFAPGDEWAGAEIINEFTRDVRGILARAAQKWGHAVKLCARTLPDPQKALDLGFDALTWAREGLIDVLVPSPRWATADYDIPVELWARMLKGTNVKLAAGIEILQRTSPDKPYMYTTRAGVRALAAQYLSMGADSVYLFNYMDNPAPDAAEQKRLNAEYGGDYPLEKANYTALLREIGDKNAVINSYRRHAITYSDICPAWQSARKRSALPMTLSAGEMATLRVRTGEIPAGARVEICIAAAPSRPEALKLYANGAPCAYRRAFKPVPAYSNNDMLAFEVDAKHPLPPFQVLEIVSECEITIDCAEARVYPIKYHG